ncbi:class I SAM-dependent methyltransferase [Gammaproteobacteria bacterium]|jgi:SAM-dependent methyltransferase|nr:class I SAM-dependent methyltransferase [Gammaproteobacteria bacterium]MDC0891135.1 class I SAM-dependent methyltransferase [Gammaproteobacteria bacterium]
MSKNIDTKTVKSFGDEWSRFDQSRMTDAEAEKIFNEYFSIFPWTMISKESEGFDMGSGSGRWAKWIAGKVGTLNCIDPSDALEVSKKTLSQFDNINYYKASVDDDINLCGSQDFGYSLGVLHHIPNTQLAIASCAKLLKPGAPFLVYLYYSFDNRPIIYRIIWKISDLVRRMIYVLPSPLKHFITDLIALFVYFPLTRISLISEKLGIDSSNIPLSYYKKHSFFTMRTDSRDRFGTPLEQRFSKKVIQEMMEIAGLEKITFSTHAPFWCAVGFKKLTETK